MGNAVASLRPQERLLIAGFPPLTSLDQYAIFPLVFRELGGEAYVDRLAYVRRDVCLTMMKRPCGGAASNPADVLVIGNDLDIRRHML